MIRKKPKIETILDDIEAKGFALSQRSMDYDGGSIEILYIQQLTDRVSLMDFVIRPLSLYVRQESNAGRGLKAKTVAQNVLYVDDYELQSDGEEVQAFILDGKVVILLPDDDDEYIVINLKKVEHRSISEPTLEYTLRGPRDCFVENLDTNLSLIRYRNKDAKLRICQYKVGKRTKTNVAMFYIEDIANDKVVSLMKQRIQAINVDGIGDSGELEVFLQNSNLNLFPQMGAVERSDMAQHLLHEGKVLVLVDGSGLALSAPKCFPEYFFSCDDRYDNMYFGLFMRILRYASFSIALYATCFYVGISEFHIDALPSRYVISLAEMRASVPFPPIIGGLMLEFVVELLREALLRVPKQIGPAVGIVSAIVIGQAAISAGIFSPLLLILASISLLASFVMPDFALINPIRILKFIAILCTGLLGFYGLVLFSCVLLIHFVSIESFGVPYFAPFAPFNRYDFVRSFIFNISISPFRPRYLKNKDNTRRKV
ncbi:MAG: spore germination protein [Christensenellaceae bacterium]|nr:spore germination protein [Christensenellaceae bacterium]